MNRKVLMAVFAGALLCSTPARAVDGALVEGIAGDNDSEGFRIGATWNWQRKWFADRSWQLGGYWEAKIGSWDNPRGHIKDISLTPVFRLAPGRTGPYVEAAVGVHYLDPYPSRDGRVFSTKIQFGSRLGFGYRFGERGKYDIGLRGEHLSNAGLDEPNPGINYLALRFQYHLD